MGILFIGVEAAAALSETSALALGKGAIIGAMIVGAAFLAGISVLRKSAAAFSGFLMLAAACAMQAVWLGVTPTPSPSIIFLLQGMFAATGLFFISAVIGLASRATLVGGALFVGALCLAGLGALNALLGGEAAGAQRIGTGVAAIVAIGLAAMAGMRGDLGARLVLPGAMLAAVAPLMMGAGGGALALAPQMIFAIGVLIASIAALGALDARAVAIHSASPAANFDSAGVKPPSHAHLVSVSENQLAQVLDYAGIAVWDWNRASNHQTTTFGAIMGADSDGAFTPEAFAEFVHADDRARFDEKILGVADGDGGFDEVIKLQGGKRVRLRGARAVDYAGRLERLVVFLEENAAAPNKDEALKLAASSLTGAIATATAAPTSTPSASRLFAAKAPEQKRSKEKDVVSAIDAGEVVAAFQPIVCFETGRVCGAEALLRWPGADASSALLKTEEVVRLAQAGGKGRALAGVMLAAAADHVCERLAAGDHGYFAAFNVSVSQVREEGFVDDVKKAIADHKLPKGALVLELTEGERLAETPKIIETFKALKAVGAALAYDDFGAGFSSLSNLHKYDFDYLKIDKSFIDDIVANGGKKKIVAALAKLGRDFDMGVIAEGVETKEAADIAKAIGCRMGQGYYLGAPLVTPPLAARSEAVVVIEHASDKSAPATDGDEIVLDRSMQAQKSAGRLFKRRGFGRP